MSTVSFCKDLRAGWPAGVDVCCTLIYKIDYFIVMVTGKLTSVSTCTTVIQRSNTFGRYDSSILLTLTVCFKAAVFEGFFCFFYEFNSCDLYVLSLILCLAIRT